MTKASSFASAFFTIPAREHLLPTEAQTVLLRAALDTDGEAAKHFGAWTKMVDFEGEFDQASYNLLPLVWATLADRGVSHRLMPRLKGVIRNNWVKTTRRIAITERALRALRQARIATMCVRGLPLAGASYGRAALRPVYDIDVVIPADLVPLASQALRGAGFLPSRPLWHVGRLVRGAWPHFDPAERDKVDLHAHVLFECPQKPADAHFWGSALPLQVGSESSLQLCPTDLLIHVVVHGIRGNPYCPVRWIADAATILRSDAVIDWSRVCDFAARFQLGGRIGLGLGILEHDFQLPIPEGVLTNLSSQITLIERIELAAMHASQSHGFWRQARRASSVLRMFRCEFIEGLTGALFRTVFRRGRRNVAGQRG